jgi:hypothetical protein
MQIGKSHLYLEREKVRRLFLLISIMDLDSNALSRTTVMYITFRDLNPQDVTPEVLNNVQSGFDSRAKLLFEGKPSSNTLP